MAKICLIGAGSTVFAQNILSDVLSNPELADSDIRLHDIDPERLGTSEVVARRIADSLGLEKLRVSATTDRRKALKRRRLRHPDDAGRRLSAGDGGRLRDPQAIRPPPDHRRHLGHRRNLPRASHDSRCARHLPRHAGALSRRLDDELRQPDGDEYLGGRPGGARHPLCRPVPQRPGDLGASGALPRRADRRHRFPLCRPQPCRLLSQIREAPWQRNAGGSLSPPTPDGTRRRLSGQGCRPFRDHEAVRAFRDRIQRAFRRIQFLVHQAGPRRSGAEVLRSARRIYQTLRKADRRLAPAPGAASSRTRRSRSRSARATNTRPPSSMPW